VLPASVAHSVNYISLLSGLKVLSRFLQFARASSRQPPSLNLATSFITLHFLPVALGSVTLHSFQSLNLMPAAHNFARLLVALGCGAVTVFVSKTKTPPAPCVYNIGRPRIRTSCSRSPTQSSTRRTAR
jgi:hypothetical protein